MRREPPVRIREGLGVQSPRATRLILWLAYKEAKAMIHFEAVPTAEAPRDG